MTCFETELVVKGSLRVRVKAPNKEDAEAQAIEQATEMLGPFMDLSDLYVHRSRAIPAEPAVRTVFEGHDVGDGCINDSAADV